MRALILILALLTAGPALAAPQPPDVIEAALRSVVRIEPDWGRAADDTGLARGLGSGFVIDAAGRVVTNAHVLGEEETVVLVSPDGGRRRGRVVGHDALTDIALIAPDGGAFAPALPALGEGDLRTGQRVYALGSPIAYPFSATEGIVSGAGRAYDAAWPVDFIQHDAAINPGSSGGPLIDAEGRWIGMNTATPPETLFDIGIGLAIPAEQVLEVAEALGREGRLARGGLGVMVRGADSGMLAALGVEAPFGLLIDEVDPASAAHASGLEAGDVLLGAEGRGLRYPRDLSAVLLGARTGETLELEVARAGEVRRVRIALDAAAAAAPARGRTSLDALTGRERRVEGPGVRLASAEDGVVVNEVAEGSLAATYGVRRGDVVLAVDGRPAVSAEEVMSALSSARGLVVLRLLRPGRGTRHLALPLNPEEAARRPPGLPTELGSGPL